MNDIWRLLEGLEPLEKGFDSDEHILPHFAIPVNRKAGRQVLSRELCEQDITGTLTAISELAAWYVMDLHYCDSDDEEVRFIAGAVAQEIADMALALKAALTMKVKEPE